MQGYTPLHVAALLGHLDAVKALLGSTPDGAFVDAKDSEACPTSALNAWPDTDMFMLTMWSRPVAGLVCSVACCFFWLCRDC